METDPTRMSEKLVGLGDVELVGIDDLGEGEPLVVVIRSRMARPTCEGCGGRCGPRGIAPPCRWICRRTAVRFGCGGGSVAGRARTPSVRSLRSLNKTPRSVRLGRC